MPLRLVVLVLALATSLPAESDTADRIGVMLQLDNLLPPSHRWDDRAKEMERQFELYPNQSGDEGMKGEGSVAQFVDWANGRIDKVMKGVGQPTLPSWITEVDYPAEEKHESPDPGFHKGEASQARFVTEHLPRLVDGRPERKVFYASLLDDYDSGGEFESTGLIASDAHHRIGRRREAYAAMKALLAGPTGK